MIGESVGAVEISKPNLYKIQTFLRYVVGLAVSSNFQLGKNLLPIWYEMYKIRSMLNILQYGLLTKLITSYRLYCYYNFKTI